MKLDNALKIEGWMNEPELIWLATQAECHERIVEIGCWMGRSTRALADNTNGTVIAVDTWMGSEEHQSALIDKHPDWLYGVFMENMKGTKAPVIPVRLPSVEAALEVVKYGHRFDMIFIDASHDLENVRADIKAWLPLVSMGGLISGHDSGYPPVAQAVNELLPDRVHEGDMWVWRRKG